MAVMNPEYDIDMTGTENLFAGVVAYVEVRSYPNDISNDIAREMREMGATVSDKRNKNVTHVIFREGTLRTSNWAKKHNIPLVSVGWLASSARRKIKFLCTPWQEPYLQEELDICGLTKRRKYKRYCKWMNVEEFEEEMNRSSEKLNKKMEKSMNKSKMGESSFDSKTDEYIRNRLFTDPPLPPRPPTPEFVKKHRRRHERLKNGGRYSWESSDEEKDTTSDRSEKEVVDIVPEISLVVDTAKIDEEEKENTCVRPLFNRSKEDTEMLVEPVRKKHKKNVLSYAIPKPVLQKVNKVNNNKENKRKSKSTIEGSPRSKKRKKESLFNLSITIPKKDTEKEDSILSHSTLIPQSPLFFTDKKNNDVTPNFMKTPLSPLVTNQPSTSTPSHANLTTPKNKRLSLRTRLLKNSARKRFREGSQDSTKNLNKLVLVPETVLVNRKKEWIEKSSIGSNLIVPETPESTNKHNESMIGNIFGTPSISRILDEMIPDRGRNITVNNGTPLFVIKESYNQYSRAITPCFTRQIKNVMECLTQTSSEISPISIVQPPQNTLYDILDSPASNNSNMGCLTASNISTMGCLTEKSSEITPISIVQPLKNTIHDILDTPVSNYTTLTGLTPPSNVTSGHSIFQPSKEHIVDETYTLNSTPLSKQPSKKSQNVRKSVCLTKSPNYEESRNFNPHTERTKEDAFEIFKTPTVRYNTRRSSILNIISPIVPAAQTTEKRINLKRHWSAIDPDKVDKSKIKTRTNKRITEAKKFRDSTDDFVLSPPTKTTKKKAIPKSIMSPMRQELVIVGLEPEEVANIKASCYKLSPKYVCVDIIRTKEQLIVVPDQPKRSMDIMKALIYGNKLVSLRWVHKSVSEKKWVDYAQYTVAYTDMVDMSTNGKSTANLTQLISTNPTLSSLFESYAAMYISTHTTSLVKYKLRVLIELAGGTVTDSFRQAGIVIDTRKVNALSVKSAWIVDCVSQGRIVDQAEYLIT